MPVNFALERTGRGLLRGYLRGFHRRPLQQPWPSGAASEALAACHFSGGPGVAFEAVTARLGHFSGGPVACSRDRRGRRGCQVRVGGESSAWANGHRVCNFPSRLRRSFDGKHRRQREPLASARAFEESVGMPAPRRRSECSSLAFEAQRGPVRPNISFNTDTVRRTPASPAPSARCRLTLR